VLTQVQPAVPKHIETVTVRCTVCEGECAFPIGVQCYACQGTGKEYIGIVVGKVPMRVPKWFVASFSFFGVLAIVAVILKLCGVPLW
jgi:hypothetical protein